jgi:hypothetical protein
MAVPPRTDTNVIHHEPIALLPAVGLHRAQDLGRTATARNHSDKPRRQ